jgi:predicted HD phosphohydrolase
MASLPSLQLQGGPCSSEELAEFERGAFAEEALQLRRWDDAAKIAGLSTPPVEHYRRALEAGLRSNDANA